MSYSAGKPLAAKLVFSDLTETPQYTFESADIAATPGSPIQDFNAESIIVHNGVNDDHGTVSIMISDPNKTLLDSTKRAGSKILNQWNLQLSLGKVLAGLQREMYTKVFRTHVIRDDTNLLHLMIFCVGWGVRGTERLSSMKRFQKKQSDGITLDGTDTAVYASEIFKDIFRTQDHYPYRSLPLETAINSAGYSLVPDNTMQYADFQETFQTWTHLMARIASATGSLYGITRDRAAYLHPSQTVDSGFLITNDINAMLTTNWNQQKLAYWNGALEYYDSTEQSGYSVVHLFNTINFVKDIDQVNENASFDMSTKYIAIPITPTKAVLGKVAIKMKKNGTPATDAVVRFVGSSGGLPVVTDQRFRTTIPVQKLTALSSSVTSYVEVPFNKLPVIPGTLYFLILDIYGTGANTYYPSYQTGATANAYYDSSDGTTWTAHAAGQVPAFTVRTYEARAIKLTAFNTTTYQKLGLRELPIPIRDTMDLTAARLTLQGIADQLGKTRRIYQQVSITPPYNLPAIGNYVRFVDSFTGLDITADVVGYDYNIDADNDSNLGVREVKINLEEFR